MNRTKKRSFLNCLRIYQTSVTILKHTLEISLLSMATLELSIFLFVVQLSRAGGAKSAARCHIVHAVFASQLLGLFLLLFFDFICEYGVFVSCLCVSSRRRGHTKLEKCIQIHLLGVLCSNVDNVKNKLV